MSILTKSESIQTDFLKKLGLKQSNHGTSTGLILLRGGRKSIKSYSPVDGALIGSVTVTTREQYDAILTTATEAFKVWRTVPAPKRGEIVRQFGEELRKSKDALGRLVSYEMGKSLQERLGRSARND